MANAVEMSTMRKMVAQLNRYRHEYYNLNAPSVADDVYDYMYDELLALEEHTGVCMANSPTQTVGYPVVSALPKVAHDIPLLSLDKTKSIEDLIAFQAGRTVDLLLKLDGLTTELIYENGQLIRLSTRGDGYIGENITHNAKAISGIPERIPYEDRLVVVGESFIHNSDFESLKSITDSAGNPYKNSRNLAAGSIRAFDAAICAQRHVSFLPFSVLEGFEEYTDWANGKHARLLKLTEFGFGVIHAVQLQNGDKAQYEQLIAQMREAAEKSDLPIDGLVLTYDEVDYSRTCGRTGHHFKDGLAFKFEDELYQSVLRDLKPLTDEKIGRVGTLKCEIPLVEFTHFVIKSLGCNGLRYTDCGKPVHRVAVGGGACGDYIPQAIAAGCDTFVTSDLRYHEFLDNTELNLIDAGHFPTEDGVCAAVVDYLQKVFPAATVIKTTAHRSEVIQYCIKEK